MRRDDPERNAAQEQLARIRSARLELSQARAALDSHLAGARIAECGGIHALDPACYRRERDAALARLRRVSRP